MKIKKQAHMSGLAARLAAFAAAVIMLMTVLPACRKDSGGGDESSTIPEETKSARICADGASEYEIIRPDRNYDGELKEAVQTLRLNISPASIPSVLAEQNDVSGLSAQ